MTQKENFITHKCVIVVVVRMYTVLVLADIHIQWKMQLMLNDFSTQLNWRTKISKKKIARQPALAF